jgi:O-antigen ligase
MNSLYPKISGLRFNSEGSFSYLCAMLAMIVMPLHVQFLPPVMILWVLCWILEKRNIPGAFLRSDKMTIILFLTFTLYYLWQLAGLGYSSDMKMGMSNAFGRLSLLVFPLVLYSPGDLIRKKTGVLLKVFAVCTLIFMAFCFSFALVRSLSLKDGIWIFDPHLPDYPWLSYFYGADLTFFIHPSYLAMYVLLSAFISLEAGFEAGRMKLYKIVWFIAGALLLITLFFISSRAGLLAALLIIPVYFFLKLRSVRNSRWIFLAIILALIISLPLLLKNQRVDYLYDKLTNKETLGENREEPRMVIWKSAFRLIRENIILGVGIGDVRKELTREYDKIGQEEMVQNRLNAHNQYIEVLLENGIIGLLIFLSLLILMMYIAVSDRNLIYGIFLAIILLFFLFETVLYRLAGVSFFALFSFLLLYAAGQKSAGQNV